jgi:hypothetical protein
MPVQKGKQRRKPRNRVRRDPSNESVEFSGVAAPKARASKPVGRARRQPPLWLNVTLGLIMVVAGTYFTIFSPGGLGTVARLILLLGYFLIAGYYFGKAYRQYRRRAAA